MSAKTSLLNLLFQGTGMLRNCIRKKATYKTGNINLSNFRTPDPCLIINILQNFHRKIICFNFHLSNKNLNAENHRENKSQRTAEK